MKQILVFKEFYFKLEYMQRLGINQMMRTSRGKNSAMNMQLFGWITFGWEMALCQVIGSLWRND
jgi:hypothetical protein